MRIPIRYSYKTYPYSEKATKFSKSLAILTTWPMYFLYIPLVYLPLSLLLIAASAPTETANVILIIASIVIAILLLRLIKRKLQAKIEQIAKEDQAKYFRENAQKVSDLSKFGDIFGSK